MPTVHFADTEIQCPHGANLRQVLRRAGVALYNGPMGMLHCRGLGTCGTCAVQIEGAVSPPTTLERWRLNFPPHNAGIDRGLRLACQCRVDGDLTVKKLDGWWGQGPRS